MKTRHEPVILTFCGTADSRVLLGSLLDGKGFSIIHGDPCLPPLQTIRHNNPDLVLLEMDMPGVSGLEIVGRIRKDTLYADLPILGLGDDDGYGMGKLAIVAGCSRFVDYPLERDALCGHVRAALAGDWQSVAEREQLKFYKIFTGALIEKLEGRLEALEEKNLALIDERERQADLTIQVLTSMATMIETKDPYTRGHSGQVTMLAVALGKKVGLQGEEMKVLERASMLHDIGKIAIDLAQIRKPGPLDADEKERLDQHPEFGFRILSPIDFLQDEALVVRHHHARFEDYASHLDVPRRIRRIACIITLADSFDAMTSRRTYNQPRPMEDAKREIERCAGKHFDPELVAPFLEVVDEVGFQPYHPL